MEDPKRQAWLYLVVGAIAVVTAVYFLATQGMGTGAFGFFDWVILGMGIVAVYRGVKGLAAIRRDGATPPEPGSSTTFRRKSTKDDPAP